MKKNLLLILFISFYSFGANATGLMSCDSGNYENWKSEEMLTEKLTKEGWKVSYIEVDEGCYEAYGKMPDGKYVEAYFDPNSFEMLLVAQRGDIIFKK